MKPLYRTSGNEPPDFGTSLCHELNRYIYVYYNLPGFATFRDGAIYRTAPTTNREGSIATDVQVFVKAYEVGWSACSGYFQRKAEADAKRKKKS